MSATSATAGLPALLIKKIPREATAEDVLNLFKPHGEIVQQTLKIRRGGVVAINYKNPAITEKVAKAGPFVLAGETLTVEAKPALELVAPEPSNNVYIAKVPKDITSEDVKAVFLQFGEIENAEVKSRAGADTAYAFISFATMAAAANAVAQSGKVVIEGEAVPVEFKKPVRAPAAKPARKPASNGDGAAGADGKPAGGRGGRSRGGAKNGTSGASSQQKQQKGENGQSQRAPKPASEPASTDRSIYIKSLPNGTTNDELKKVFVQFGNILRAEVRFVPTSVFVDFKTKEDLERILAANSTPTEKKGPFGVATLQCSASRSRKHEAANAMYVSGFGTDQNPTEQEVMALYGGGNVISRVTILASRTFGFVDFEVKNGAQDALAAAAGEGVFLPGVAASLELEQSNHVARPKRNFRRRRGPNSNAGAAQ